MNRENKSVSFGGIGLPGALALIFVVLKLTGTSVIATWSWWWVLSPIWITWIVAFLIFYVMYAIARNS